MSQPPVSSEVKASITAALEAWRDKRWSELSEGYLSKCAPAKEVFLTDSTIAIWAEAGNALLDADGARYMTDWEDDWVIEERDSILHAIRTMRTVQAQIEAKRKNANKASEAAARKRRKKQPNQYSRQSLADTPEDGQAPTPPVNISTTPSASQTPTAAKTDEDRGE